MANFWILLGDNFEADMMNILSLILGVAAAMGVLYAIFLAVELARAQDESKRKQAKDRMIKAFASVVIILVLIGMAQLFNNLQDIDFFKGW